MPSPAPPSIGPEAPSTVRPSSTAGDGTRADDGRGAPRVVQVVAVRDPALRTGQAMLDAWVALRAMARASADAGFATTVVQAAWRDEEIVEDGVRYLFVAPPAGVPSRLSRQLNPRLIGRVRRLRPDVAHWHGVAFPQLRLLCGRGAAVLVHHHSDAPCTGWRMPLQRWGLRRVDGAAFATRELAEPYVAAGVLDARVPVFEVLEATSSFTPGSVGEARRETGIGGDPCLLWLGHLDANKDPLTILHAVSLASRHLPDIRLWMCYGTAPLEAEVRARLDAEPELAARVTLVGRVPHARVEALCRAADFLVQGSARETSSYAMMEAVACGATPLVSDIPAFRRMTANGAVGGLFARGDAAALARLVIEQAAIPAEERRRAARAHFDRRLSPAALSRDLAAAYHGVLSRRA